MMMLGWIVLLVSWCAWWYPFVFLAPHTQKRPSITAIGPTRAGLFLESLAIFIAFVWRLPPQPSREAWRIAGAAACGLVATILFWTAVRHLGRQFRVHAGLYEDHQLVTSGPYAIVRHPIYTGYLVTHASFLVAHPAPWNLAVILIADFALIVRALMEERVLSSDAAYQRYCERVGWHLVPGVF